MGLVNEWIDDYIHPITGYRDLKKNRRATPRVRKWNGDQQALITKARSLAARRRAKGVSKEEASWLENYKKNRVQILNDAA